MEKITVTEAMLLQMGVGLYEGLNAVKEENSRQFKMLQMASAKRKESQIIDEYLSADEKGSAFTGY